MNIKTCLKKKGLQIEVSSLGVWNSVDISFINSDGMEDETQFDVMFAGTKAGNEELAALYKDFCKENHFPTNTVQSVTIVKSARTYAELSGFS